MIPNTTKRRVRDHCTPTTGSSAMVSATITAPAAPATAMRPSSASRRTPSSLHTAMPISGSSRYAANPSTSLIDPLVQRPLGELPHQSVAAVVERLAERDDEVGPMLAFAQRRVHDVLTRQE